MFKTLILMCLLLEWVECGSDLCKNGATVDSITFIDNKKMWFFTSGGHYWLLKGEDFPPKSAGTPLPGGFKRGDAAIYRDTLRACPGVSGGEQEIHLMEFNGNENKILIYDTRTNQWINEKEPLVYNKDRGLGQAKVDWTQPIDSAFIYKKVYIVVIQGSRYSVVDIQNLCNDKNGWGDGKQSQSTTDMNVRGKVDGTAAIDDDYFYLFQRHNFWKIGVKSFKTSLGQMTTVKQMQQNIVTDFFHFQEDCQLPPEEEAGVIAQSEDTPLDENTLSGNESDTTEKPVDDTTTAEPEDKDDTTTEPPDSSSTTESSEESGFPWWLLIVIILILLLVILLIICLLMRKGKDKDKDKESAQPIATTPSTVSGAASKPKSSSNIGEGSSTMSVRSNAGLTAKGKTTSKTKSKSSLGTSPSQMSIRSNAGLATTKSEVSKTGSKK